MRNVPGVRTSEFWATVLKLIVATVTAFGALFHPGFAVPAVVQAAVPSVSVAAAAVAVAVYTHSRGKIKAAAIELARDVPVLLPSLFGPGDGLRWVQTPVPQPTAPPAPPTVAPVQQVPTTVAPPGMVDVTASAGS